MPALKRNVMPSGYVRVWVPGHPTANADGYALEHRYVLYEAGIAIPPGWQSHHLDGDKQNNDLGNLAVLTESAHHRLHIREAGFVTNQFGTFAVQPHGAAAYQRGCRCAVCREANTLRCRLVRERRKARERAGAQEARGMTPADRLRKWLRKGTA